MGEYTAIEWAAHTFNPWEGCTKVSEACRNCYAETRAERFKSVKWGKGHPRRRTSPGNWRKPLQWNKAARELRLQAFTLNQPPPPRPRVFCLSLGDIADEEVPESWRDDTFALAELCTELDWLFLTKRVDVLRDYLAKRYPNGIPDHFWVGCTVEDQTRADERIPILLEIPARVRFLSVEPLLGPVDLGLRFAGVPAANWSDGSSTPAGPYPWPSRWIRLRHPVRADPICMAAGLASPNTEAGPAVYRAHSNRHGALSVETPGGRLGVKPDEFESLPGVDWVIAGGESGPGARPSHPDWFRSIRDQCAAAGVPFLFKQWGKYAYSRDPWENDALDPVKRKGEVCINLAGGQGFHGEGAIYMVRLGKKKAGRLLDGRTWDEVPTP